MKHAWDAAKRTHTWTFAGAIKPVMFVVPAIKEIVDRTCDYALVLGYKQKIANGAAIPHNTETGKAATDAEKREGMQEIVDRLMKGEWNATVRAAASRKVDVTALVAVIAAARGKPSEKVRAFVEGKDEAGRRALADSAEFAESYVQQVAKSRVVVQLAADVEAELDAIGD